ncbi:MAG: hypothetical protein LAT53_07415 [Idiomarina sp.]|nr:hypothetical protein [Idiomarina sp.]
MSTAYYPQQNRRRRERDGERTSKPEQVNYFQQAFTCLKAMPERVDIIRQNLEYYEQQPHLPKSAKAAIKRFQYLLAVTNDPAEMERWVMADSYEGRKFRQLPLLLKGVCDE